MVARLLFRGIKGVRPQACQAFLASKRAVIWYNTLTMSIQPSMITTTQNQPLIGIPFEENGKEVIRYFSEETQADKAVAADKIEETLKLAGAWSDLPFQEMEEALDHIRHDSQPTCDFIELMASFAKHIMATE